MTFQIELDIIEVSLGLSLFLSAIYFTYAEYMNFGDFCLHMKNTCQSYGSRIAFHLPEKQNLIKKNHFVALQRVIFLSPDCSHTCYPFLALLFAI